MAATRLEMNGLTRSFGGRRVVDDLSLSIEAGQVTCLLGPSGCGKSTTLRMVAGVETPDAGTIHVDGTLICDGPQGLPPEERGVGLMFQDFALFPHLSVADNVAYGLKGARAEKKARVGQMLERVRMARFASAFPHQLSGGEQQRIALARALAPRPRVMLMDEPFSGLDNRLRDGIRDETLELLKSEDTAVLLVTHEPEEAMRMADEIALMRDGKIIQHGAPYNVYTRPVDQQSMGFFSEINRLHAVVQGALADTPLGKFLAPGVPDGTSVEIAFRPQHVRIDFDRSGQGPAPTEHEGEAARAEVLRARFLGHESLIVFRLGDGGSEVRATVPGVFLPSAGRIMWLRVPRDRCFVFA
ncbi:MAG: ABC transporter ATP-binding protein [Pseudomonadota bacterium]